jgi:putative tricarboxylic transport membrane protein
MRKKTFLIMSIIFLVMFTLVGCGSKQTSSEPAKTETTTEDSSKTSSDTSKDSNSEAKTEQKEDDFPSKPITIVVPFSAGGSGDTMSRTFAKIAEQNFGQQFIIVNKPGGSGAIALSHALTKPADGYTILYHSSTLPFTMASGGIPFTPEDIQPVAIMVSNYQVLSVPADSPFKTFEDFVQYGKDNPGKLKIGGAGINGTNHVFGLKIIEETGIEADYVSYDGGGDTLRAILGGNVHATVTSGEVVTQSVEEGKVRLLGVSSAERVADQPEVPTFKELGLESIDDELIWRAFFGKPGIPPERLAKFNELVVKVSESPEWGEYVETTNQQYYYRSFEDFTKIFNNYYSSGKKLFEKLK